MTEKVVYCTQKKKVLINIQEAGIMAKAGRGQTRRTPNAEY